LQHYTYALSNNYDNISLNYNSEIFISDPLDLQNLTMDQSILNLTNDLDCTTIDLTSSTLSITGDLIATTINLIDSVINHSS
jgi:hypothetical protein